MLQSHKPISQFTLRGIRSLLIAFCFLLTNGLVLENVAAGTDAKQLQWITTWAAPSDSAAPELEPQTLRQIMRVSLGGTAVRVRISNEYGDRPLQIHAATIAYHDHDGLIREKSAKTMRLAGKEVFSVPVGQSVTTDAVELAVDALQELAISLYFAQGTGAATIHSTGLQTVYITNKEDQTAFVSPRVDNKDDSRYFVTDIDVLAESKARSIVIVGDSTSDGVGSGQDRNMRWPDQLASRLQMNQATRHIAVINSGISGNRILNDGLDPFLGPSTLKRFDRDVLNRAKVEWIVLLQGVNDIAGSLVFSDAKQVVSATQIIEGMREIIDRAHAHKIKVYGATILPRAGATGPLASTPKSEEMRQQVNAWIRNSKAFDAFIDFDEIIRDPAQVTRQLPQYNSGDGRHPNAMGYQIMAAAIDLSLFE